MAVYSLSFIDMNTNKNLLAFFTIVEQKMPLGVVEKAINAFNMRKFKNIHDKYRVVKEANKNVLYFDGSKALIKLVIQREEDEKRIKSDRNSEYISMDSIRVENKQMTGFDCELINYDDTFCKCLIDTYNRIEGVEKYVVRYGKPFNGGIKYKYRK